MKMATREPTVTVMEALIIAGATAVIVYLAVLFSPLVAQIPEWLLVGIAFIVTVVTLVHVINATH